MPEVTARTIRIPAPGEAGQHEGHKIRTINVSKSKGIKALYCVNDKKIITYLFAKNKDWTLDKGKEWVAEHTKRLVEIREITVDQVEEFLKLSVTYTDGEVKLYEPNSPSFIFEEVKFDKDLESEEGEIMDGKEDLINVNEAGMQIVKFDKDKRLVYGVFLVPEEADHDGDVISHDDVEKVAHGFMAEYRTIDEMHKEVIKADIVESAIAWGEGLTYYGKELSKGTWFGAVKVYDDEVWNKVLSGDYQGFSVRISGTREPIAKEA